MAVRYTPATNLDATVRRVTTPGRERVAAQVVDDAQVLAPVDTGKFRDSFAVVGSGDDVRVVNTDPKAVYVELGTSDTPAFGTLAAAASRHGTLRG